MDDATEKDDLPTPESKHPNDLPTTTRTYYDLLAEEIMEDLDRVAAKIPKLEAHHRVTENEIRAHVNVPRPFLRTAVAAVEQTEGLPNTRKLVPEQGHDTLQYLDAFRFVEDKLAEVKAYVRFTLQSRQTALAVRALQLYAIARGLARGGRRSDVTRHVENLRRDLGKRGRPRKK
jgi:DNA-binding phage protein